MTSSSISWSELYAARRRVQKRYRKIWNLPIAKRYSTVLHAYGNDGARVLEVGAGSRGLREKLLQWWPNTQYKSYDIDPNTEQDFHDLDKIAGEYDIICMFEVIEHVTPSVAKEILGKCYEVMAPGGQLFVTTPNVYYPPNYLRDATHITPWCYDELGAVALMAGFDLTVINRLYTDQFLGKLLHRVLFYPIHRILGIDYSKQIIMVASKPSASSS